MCGQQACLLGERVLKAGVQFSAASNARTNSAEQSSILDAGQCGRAVQKPLVIRPGVDGNAQGFGTVNHASHIDKHGRMLSASHLR